jgi:hypothetical protein
MTTWHLGIEQKPPHRPFLRCVKGEDGLPRVIEEDTNGDFVLLGYYKSGFESKTEEAHVKELGRFNNVWEAMAVGEGTKPLWTIFKSVDPKRRRKLSWVASQKPSRKAKTAVLK